MAALVDQPIVLQYLGFETKGAFREYAFNLCAPGGVSSHYFVTIPNEAFSAHRARYQDAPAICSLKLQRELASEAALAPSSTILVTDKELAHYLDAHTPETKRGPSKSAED